MQAKRFEPAWIADTSVGVVSFQSDYHLKELPMGEHAQPVLGMKSCHEYSDEDRGETNWYALEGFVARKAEVQVSEDNACCRASRWESRPGSSSWVKRASRTSRRPGPTSPWEVRRGFHAHP